MKDGELISINARCSGKGGPVWKREIVDNPVCTLIHSVQFTSTSALLLVKQGLLWKSSCYLVCEGTALVSDNLSLPHGIFC